MPTSFKCPFTGMTAQLSSRRVSETTCAVTSSPAEEDPGENDAYAVRPIRELGCPMSRLDSPVESPEQSVEKAYVSRNMSFSSTASTALSVTEESTTSGSRADVGLSGNITKNLFPYHVMVNRAFTIEQVGRDLPSVLRKTEDELVGQHVADILNLTKPVGVTWDWEWLRRLEDQAFDVEPVGENCDVPNLRFKSTVVHVSESPPLAMLMLTPDANNLEDLREMNLTLSDLPVHGAHRDAIFLREHLSTQMNNALKMEKLSRSLEREKTLLESLLPEHAAAGLREGKTVEPMLHNNVTFFFSDIVGFTSICEQIYPWDVINMLNRLYCTMDFLAGKFNLFKVETIGDAYVCCSGLPQADGNHAMNIANFAIAVNHCCKQVLSPLNDSPIQLRIGIHSGSCASGVVGMTNPRYCVFGDTVNTTARHESTGAPGKIHCSSETQKELERMTKGSFRLQERGFVDMKGKGEKLTYWLSATEKNKLVNGAAVEALEAEVKELLCKTNFDSKLGRDAASKKRSNGLEKGDSVRSLLEAFKEQTASEMDNRSLAETLSETKPPRGDLSRSSSLPDALDEARTLACQDIYMDRDGSPCSDASQLSLNYEPGEEHEKLKAGEGITKETGNGSFADVSKNEERYRLNIGVSPFLSELATGSGQSGLSDYFYFM